MEDNRPYFHELAQSVINDLLNSKAKVSEVLEKYKQPDWCDYPEAIRPFFGCWSLTDMREGGLRTKISEQYCSSCDCFKTAPATVTG